MPRDQVLPHDGGDDDAGLTRFGSRRSGEQNQLFALARPAPFDGDRREEREADVGEAGSGRVEVASLRLERGSFETGERAAQLLVRTAVRLTSHRAKKRVERKGERTVGGFARLLKAVHELHVHVLIERAGQAVAR